ncbi:NUDIX domain-containing protein [Streptomyces thermolineatus]|uniref:NUDIX domain-containing protein n=1 Tax=Streptomyces thermolineatus TaxID=44033 RepID=A0ABP5ZEI3_9ACTN
MAIPPFLRDIRAKCGHDLLLLPGVVTVTFDDEGRVLLGRRADNGRWALISGIPEPGEEPADTAVREVLEETGVHVVPERIVAVRSTPPIDYPNGDRSQYMDTVFRCRAVGGDARVNDDESLEVGWFSPDALPPIGERMVELVKLAAADGPAWFESPKGV